MLAFRGHHIPLGLMRKKAAEFMRLTQGFVDTEEKKIEHFKRGLSTKLMKTMANSRCTTYNEFISEALIKRTRTIYMPRRRAIKEQLRQAP